MQGWRATPTLDWTDKNLISSNWNAPTGSVGLRLEPPSQEGKGNLAGKFCGQFEDKCMLPTDRDRRRASKPHSPLLRTWREGGVSRRFHGAVLEGHFGPYQNTARNVPFLVTKIARLAGRAECRSQGRDSLNKSPQEELATPEETDWPLGGIGVECALSETTNCTETAGETQE
jgi:hypothetical protein